MFGVFLKKSIGEHIMNRKIIHVDIDAFFASVEQLDNPKLKGKPVIVGGIGERGVVATASYEARKYGVHSAMSTQIARKLCPNGIFLKGRHDRYKEASMEVFEVLREITNKIQKISIDEAYLDVSSLACSPKEIGIRIKKAVKKKTGLDISVGISYNKFLAKLASDWDKPDGLFEIKKDDIPQLLEPLSILKVHGLGKKTAARLNRIGIFTIEDLLKYSLPSLEPILGQLWAREIYDRIRGIDDRPVITTRERKSYGRETTFTKDIKDKEFIKKVLNVFAREIVDDLKSNHKAIRTVTIKIKFEDFHQITRSHSLEYHTDDIHIIKKTLKMILDNIELEKKIRLAGISLSNICDYDNVQLNIFDYIDWD